MDGEQDKVHSVWVPLREMNLLLPNVAVAEIGSYRVPEQLPGMPDWVLGKVKWRGHVIVVISLEAMCGMAVPSNPVFSRLMVVNSVRPRSPVHYYGIVTAGLPGLIQFDGKTADRVQKYEKNGLRCIVRVGREQAVIPDLDAVQGMLEEALDQAA